MVNFQPGITVYFISNNTHITKAMVMYVSGALYTVTFSGVTNEAIAAIRLKASRLYSTKEKAEAHLSAYVRERKQAEKEQQQGQGFRAPGLH